MELGDSGPTTTMVPSTSGKKVLTVSGTWIIQKLMWLALRWKFKSSQAPSNCLFQQLLSRCFSLCCEIADTSFRTKIFKIIFLNCKLKRFWTFGDHNVRAIAKTEGQQSLLSAHQWNLVQPNLLACEEQTVEVPAVSPSNTNSAPQTEEVVRSSTQQFKADLFMQAATTNHVDFIRFLQRIQRRIRPSRGNRTTYVVYDNHSAHKTQPVYDYIKVDTVETGHVFEFVFLPP